MVKGGPRVNRSHRSASPPRLIGGALGPDGKRKRKRLGLVLGPKELGWLIQPNRLGLALWASSACGSAGRLGFTA
jgi:hypothetical protein